jgi:hypothetical protein
MKCKVPKMKETTATAHVMKNWYRQQPNLWWWKIPDYFRPGHNYSNPRAVDTLVCVNGHFITIEWKLHKSELGFAISRVRKEQIHTSTEVNRAGGTGMLAIIVYKGGIDRHLYMIPMDVWERVATSVLTTGKKSLRLIDAFPNCRVEYRRVGAHMQWDYLRIEELCRVKN